MIHESTLRWIDRFSLIACVWTLFSTKLVDSTRFFHLHVDWAYFYNMNLYINRHNFRLDRWIELKAMLSIWLKFHSEQTSSKHSNNRLLIEICNTFLVDLLLFFLFYLKLFLLFFQFYLMRISWSHGHITHNKTDNKSWKAKTGLIKVWHNINLFQGTNTIGIKISTLRIPVWEREV